MSDIVIEQQTLNYIDAIREGISEAMQADETIFVIGEGVPDPKAIFGSTQGLRQQFGEHRVLDMPLSENAMTGMCIGASLNGLKPLLIHQRIDFSLLSADQLINQAAKWHYLFHQAVPLVVRMIIGKGWGQGPQHSQALWGLYAQVPGLKIFLPATANDAKQMMKAALNDPNPVLFIEHRWLHHTESLIEDNEATINELSKAMVLRQGDAATIVASSYMVHEALNAAQACAQFGMEIEVIDLRVGHEFDYATIAASVNKTKNLIVADLHPMHLSPGHAIISQLMQNGIQLQTPPRLVAQPNHPVPTSWYLAENSYQAAEAIAEAIAQSQNLTALQLKKILAALSQPPRTDVPNRSFCGPF
ncbi:MAG: alpha-ketoacid dehydrogenase subunit beta [Gammaproteobacteria bacterium]|nr:alpha-ketoacid dehydrogenase subunit beta [Gammaproteobacteria bacterium]MDH5729366.1 alpha-ketoacid dehydrogenase subunit beta [Gammaproteobacteria bacterium]